MHVNSPPFLVLKRGESQPHRRFASGFQRPTFGIYHYLRFGWKSNYPYRKLPLSLLKLQQQEALAREGTVQKTSILWTKF
jgi:hypothetical protein